MNQIMIAYLVDICYVNVDNCSLQMLSCVNQLWMMLWIFGVELLLTIMFELQHDVVCPCESLFNNGGKSGRKTLKQLDVAYPRIPEAND